MYQITKEELIQMIKLERNAGFKRILNNHLRAMEGHPAVCLPCVMKEAENDVQELLEPVVDEGMSDGDE